MVQIAVKKAAAKVGTVLLGSAAMVAIDKIETKFNSPEKKAELKRLQKERKQIKKRKEEQKQILNNMKKVQKIQLQKAKLDAQLAEIVGNNTIEEEPEETWVQSQLLTDD